MTKAFKEKEKQRDPKPHVWHKANNSHDLYFCNPRPPLTLMPVVITQHVIVITSNLFLKVPIQCWRCLNTHWKYTKHMSSSDPAFPEEGLLSLPCTQHTYGMNKLWTIIIKNNLCLFICLVYETDLSMTPKTLGDTHCAGVKTKLHFPLIFFPKLESKSQGRWHGATLLLLMWMGKDFSFYIKASWEEEVGGHEREKPWNYLRWFIRNSHSMGFWEGETFWKMCWCDSSGGWHIWAKAGMEQGGRRSSSLNWEHTCLQSSMSGTPTLFWKDRALCRCRNSEEAEQNRVEKGSCDDLSLRTPLAGSLPVPHQAALALGWAGRGKPGCSWPSPAPPSSRSRLLPTPSPVPGASHSPCPGCC